MKSRLKFFLAIFALPAAAIAQHQSTIEARLDRGLKTLHVTQELVFRNTTGDTLRSIVLNDWNNAYSAKDTPLARRFSDEFTRSFHLAKDEERGYTAIFSLTDQNGNTTGWVRPANHPDLIEVATFLAPGENAILHFTYDIKLPSDRFTRHGYSKNGGFSLKDCFLSPARYHEGEFIRNSNNNLDDIANAMCEWQLTFTADKTLKLDSDLTLDKFTENEENRIYHFAKERRSSFTVYLSQQPAFLRFSNDVVTVYNGIGAKRVDDIRKAVIVDQVVRFVADRVGRYPNSNIIVSQSDYDRSPFYGLSQLPSFLNVFTDDFVYELKFLKTYTNNYLRGSLQLDPRKDNWVYDAIQIWLMMDYMEHFHPDVKMTGRLERYKLLKGYNLMTQPFNGQYSYFYMLMARKNLDQALGLPKNDLLKFNEQIAGKYRAGLSLKYLDSYLGNGILKESIADFVNRNREKQTSASDFIDTLQSRTDKNIDWFYDTVVNSREIIDFKFGKISKTDDSVSFSLQNRTGAAVPVPVYGLRHKKVVFKHWIEPGQLDSTFTFARNGAEKIAINYENEMPEYNSRNNFKTLRNFTLDKPLKFTFFKDLENPYYNQILFVPTLSYNLYDGLMPGIRLYNKTLLEKPFIYDLNPAYSPNTQSLSGSYALVFNQYNRDSKLYYIRYYLTASNFHYAPDARYIKFNPSVMLNFRPSDFRDNHKQSLRVREVFLARRPTTYNVDTDQRNYSVFDVRYINTKTEVTHHFNVITDFQASSKFYKTSAEIEFRKLFENNRQLDLRLYAGTFLENRTTDDYFSFALDRPTDYLFDYNYYGRSEKTGLFSQQLILAEGGFKSKLDTPFANQWITTLNAGMNVWNWVEIYGDAGFIKNRGSGAKFRYDSGVRLNLVTDYFELFLPVYSSNGWEFQQDYSQRIRFIVTLDPKILINLFTRKWF